MRSAIFAGLLMMAQSAYALESDYQIPWCASANGITADKLQKGVHYEVPVRGGRIDCLTQRYAAEVDFAHKWKEAIAQAQWYAQQTGKIPAMLLIVAPGEERYLEYIEEYLYYSHQYAKVFTVAK